MEIITTYWPQFLSSVILPLITGVIVAIAGWYNLASKAESDVEAASMKTAIEEIRVNTSDLKQKEELLIHYQNILKENKQHDESLQKVLGQYKAMENAIANFDKYTHTPINERGALSEEVLKLITTDLVPIQQRNDLPQKPLLLKTANNTYKVLFSVPMRIPPNLKFIGLPEGVEPNVLEKTKFGFTVIFSPLSVEVNNFGFEADAEL